MSNGYNQNKNERENKFPLPKFDQFSNDFLNTTKILNTIKISSFRIAVVSMNVYILIIPFIFYMLPIVWWNWSLAIYMCQITIFYISRIVRVHLPYSCSSSRQTQSSTLIFAIVNTILNIIACLFHIIERAPKNSNGRNEKTF